jgi:hypothetical protein
MTPPTSTDLEKVSNVIRLPIYIGMYIFGEGDWVMYYYIIKMGNEAVEVGEKHNFAICR